MGFCVRLERDGGTFAVMVGGERFRSRSAAECIRWARVRSCR